MRTLRSVLFAVLAIASLNLSALANDDVVAKKKLGPIEYTTGQFLNCKEHQCNSMVTVGGGATASTEAKELQVLLRVGYEFRQELFGEIEQFPYNLVLARIRADGQIFNNENGSHVPYINIEFTPIGIELGGYNRFYEQGGSINLSALGTEIQRNVAIDKSLSVRVSAIGVKGAIVLPFFNLSEDSRPFVKLALDLLGYKMAAHRSSLGTFNGVSVGKLGLEVGYGFGEIPGFKATIALGAAADLNIGHSSGGKAVSFNSDPSVYTELTASVADLVDFFVRGSINGFWDSGNRFYEKEARILFGAVIRFYL